MKLFNTSKKVQVIENLDKATNYFARLKGLLGRKDLPDNQGLWFDDCNSIHTFFMKFPIDVVFLDKNSKVSALYENVKPQRLIWPVLTAKSTVELAVGAIQRGKIEVGDQLNVID